MFVPNSRLINSTFEENTEHVTLQEISWLPFTKVDSSSDDHEHMANENSTATHPTDQQTNQQYYGISDAQKLLEASPLHASY